MEWETAPRLVMKRVAYRHENSKESGGKTIYNDSASKNKDQVTTEFHCYELLQGCRRAVQLKEFLHENYRSKEDQGFFYGKLQLENRSIDPKSKVKALAKENITNVCFVLEEMDEGSLREQLELIGQQGRKPFSEQEAVEWSCQMAEGLLELRAKGIIHRDLRPDNILFHKGQLKFADFDSAFIRGFSDWRNIKNGVNMKETTPREVMLLVSKGEEELRKVDSEELYRQQAKADVYFLGSNIYCLVFSRPFQIFNDCNTLHSIVQKQQRRGYCPALLDLMERCLEPIPDKRIGLDEVARVLAQLEHKRYFASKQHSQVYLTPEPLNLYSFSCNQLEEKLDSEQVTQAASEGAEKEQLIRHYRKRKETAMLERHTSRYRNAVRRLLQGRTARELWGSTAESTQLEEKKARLMDQVEHFLERMQVKAYYYELAYRILCEVRLEDAPQGPHQTNIRNHVETLSNQLVVMLTFIYDNLLKASFTTDPLYDRTHTPDETRRVFLNTRKLHSRREFFQGRKKRMAAEAGHITRQYSKY
jgi:serine/threonine protein kinase